MAFGSTYHSLMTMLRNVEEEERFKFVDDLSFLEIIYLLNVGLSSYNVLSDIPTHNQVVNGDNLKTKNIYKGLTHGLKNMIFNFTKIINSPLNSMSMI